MITIEKKEISKCQEELKIFNNVVVNMNKRLMENKKELYGIEVTDAMCGKKEQAIMYKTASSKAESEHSTLNGHQTSEFRTEIQQIRHIKNPFKAKLKLAGKTKF
jgi:hypothetical protein